MPHTADFPYLVYSTSDGDVGERRALRALDYDGVPLDRNELIPLPDGATLAMMPERLAVGLDEQGDRAGDERATWLGSRGARCRLAIPVSDCQAMNCLLAPSHCRSLATPPLLAGVGVSTWRQCRTDNPERWLARNYDARRLETLVRRRLAAEPENRLLAHHAHCALDYRCPTASNLFFGRWEAACAVSAGCNARCVGCISKQEEEGLVSPQDRLTFTPTEQEIIDAAVAHLETAEDGIFSFGQGCEGEPLLQFKLIERAIRGIRARTQRGTLNINTNASNPQTLAKLYAAGLDSLRASTISARRETYDAYYRPIGYTFDHVRKSLILARDAGVYSSINLLCFPGLIDCEEGNRRAGNLPARDGCSPGAVA